MKLISKKGFIMSFQINNNLPAMNANLNLSLNNSKLDKSLILLSAATKLNSAADDASGLSIANQLSSQVSEMTQNIMNLNTSVGMTQVADGAMQGISDNTDKIRELTMRASNASLNADNRASIQNEINGLMKSSGQIASTTSFNGVNLLDGSGGKVSADARMSTIFSSPIDVTTQENASASLDVIDAGKANISSIRSSFGALQNQMESDIRNSSAMQISTASAESQMRDVDFAAESANFSKANLITQIGSYVLSQSNVSAENTMRLLK
jgi:flagellin